MQTLSQVGCYENSCIEKNRAPENTLFLPSDPIHEFRHYLNQSTDPKENALQNNEDINKICESLLPPCFFDLKNHFYSREFDSAKANQTPTETSEISNLYLSYQPKITEESLVREELEETENFFKKGIESESLPEEQDFLPTKTVDSSLKLEKNFHQTLFHSEENSKEKHTDFAIQEKPDLIKTSQEDKKSIMGEDENVELSEVSSLENNIPLSSFKENKIFKITNTEKPAENLQEIFPRLQNLVQKKRDMVVEFPVSHPLGTLNVRLRFQRGNVSAVFMSHSKNLMKLLGQYQREIDKIFESFPEPEIRFHYTGDL